MKRALCVLMAIAIAPLLTAEVILTIEKTPYEAFTCSMDFTRVIGPCDFSGNCAGTNGTTLISVTSTNYKTGAVTTSTIVAASPIPWVVTDTDIVAFRVQGGNVGEIHQVAVKVADSVTGDQFEGDMLLQIAAN